MAVRTKYTFVWVWMMTLLVATMGISVQRIYCYCAGISTVYFFHRASGCSDENKRSKVPSDCCSAKKQLENASCCPKTDHQKSKKDCSDSTSKISQLNVEFLVESLDCLKKAEKNPLWIKDVPSIERFFCAAICVVAIFRALPVPLPPRSGRDICVRLCIFRC